MVTYVVFGRYFVYFLVYLTSCYCILAFYFVINYVDLLFIELQMRCHEVLTATNSPYLEVPALNDTIDVQ